MNKINLIALAAHLETIPDKEFDMANWCGTACCLAGHEFLRTGAEKPQGWDAGNWFAVQEIYKTAQASLGLTTKEADDMFTPWAGPRDISFSKEAAIHMLHEAAETGLIHWPTYAELDWPCLSFNPNQGV